ncbi:MAG: S-layer homology domain-containing protein [Oscillospiraceae bacterium]|nr:S-layer homology domain-containing protein [Oscillospiraceae bacterium]
MKKKLLSLFLAVALLLSVLPTVFAEDIVLPPDKLDGEIYEKTVDCVIYQIDPNAKTATVIGCIPEKLPDILELPETVDGCSVTKIAAGGLSPLHSHGLILPDTLTCIEENAIDTDESNADLFICMPDNEVTIASGYIQNFYVNYCFLPESFQLSAECLYPAEIIFSSCVGYEKHKVYMGEYQHLVTVDGIMDERLMLSRSGVYRLDDGEYTMILLSDGYPVPDAIAGIPVTRVAASCEIDDIYIVLGENVRVVEDGAFVAWAWFNADYIYVPACIEYLPADYYPTYSPCTMYGTSGGYAEQYAKEHGLLFEDPEKTPFTDVPETAWFFPYVHDVYWYGLMNGTSATTFEPNATTTRAMVVQVLYNLAGEDIGYYNVFTDVKQNDWFSKAVIWAYAAGVSTGTSETTFSPNDSVTREQLAAFLYRFTTLCGFDCKERGDLSKFTDKNQISSYATDAIAWAVGVGIINGTSPTTVAPKNNATRAEIAAMLCRLLDYVYSSVSEE